MISVTMTSLGIKRQTLGSMASLSYSRAYEMGHVEEEDRRERPSGSSQFTAIFADRSR
jgi:hypothetical protein